MANKTGLHKDVSVIFDGVPLPKSKISTGLSHSAAVPSIGRTAPVTAGKPLVTRLPACNNAPTSLQNKAPTAAKAEIKITPPKPHDVKKKVSLNLNGSSKKKTMLALLLILSVVLVLILIKNLSGSSITGPAEQGNSTQTEPSATQNKINWIIPDAYPEKVRDPMGKIIEKISDVASENLVVRGIVFSEDNPSAIIGIQIFHEGDSINGTQIIKINRDSVEFLKDNKKWSQKVEK